MRTCSGTVNIIIRQSGNGRYDSPGSCWCDSQCRCLCRPLSIEGCISSECKNIIGSINIISIIGSTRSVSNCIPAIKFLTIWCSQTCATCDRDSRISFVSRIWCCWHTPCTPICIICECIVCTCAPIPTCEILTVYCYSHGCYDLCRIIIIHIKGIITVT